MATPKNGVKLLQPGVLCYDSKEFKNTVLLVCSLHIDFEEEKGIRERGFSTEEEEVRRFSWLWLLPCLCLATGCLSQVREGDGPQAQQGGGGYDPDLDGPRRPGNHDEGDPNAPKTYPKQTPSPQHKQPRHQGTHKAPRSLHPPQDPKGRWAEPPPVQRKRHSHNGRNHERGGTAPPRGPHGTPPRAVAKFHKVMRSYQKRMRVYRRALGLLQQRSQAIRSRLYEARDPREAAMYRRDLHRTQGLYRKFYRRMNNLRQKNLRYIYAFRARYGWIPRPRRYAGRSTPMPSPNARPSHPQSPRRIPQEPTPPGKSKVPQAAPKESAPKAPNSPTLKKAPPSILAPKARKAPSADVPHVPPPGGKAPNPTKSTKQPNDGTIPTQPPPGEKTPPSILTPKAKTPQPTVPTAPQPAPSQPRADGVSKNGMSASEIKRWRSFCAREMKRYSPQKRPTLMRRHQVKAGARVWKVRAYRYSNVGSMRPLYASQERYVILGKGGRYSRAHCEDRPFYLWDTKQHHMIAARPPTTSFLMKHRHLFPWWAGIKHVASEERLVHYNTTKQQAGVLLRTPLSAKQTQRYRFVYLRWDLAQDRIVRAWELGAPSCAGTFRPIGVAPGEKVFYFLERHQAPGRDCRKLRRNQAIQSGETITESLVALDLNTGSRRVVRQFKHNYEIETLLPNRDYTKIAVVEYTEHKNEKGKAYILDMFSGKTSSYGIPRTPYGIAFSRDQTRLFVYGSKEGALVGIPMRKGDKQLVRKTSPWGHAMGLSKDGRSLYLLFHKQLEIWDVATMKRIRVVSHAKTLKDKTFRHVDGSTIRGGVLFIKNDDRFYVQSFLRALRVPAQTTPPSAVTHQKTHPSRPSPKPSYKERTQRYLRDVF